MAEAHDQHLGTCGQIGHGGLYGIGVFALHEFMLFLAILNLTLQYYRRKKI
jgi:hypothetical protein